MGDRRTVAPDLEGWKAIAEYVGRSIATVQRWARRKIDPLPVSRLVGGVVAYSAKIDAWTSRNLISVAS